MALYLCDFILLFFFIYLVTFTTIHYSFTTENSISVLSVISDMCMLKVTKWQINIFQVLNEIIILTKMYLFFYCIMHA